MGQEDEIETNSSSFPATRWSLLDAVHLPDEESKFAAISEICTTYWYPLYAYLRRQGKSAEDAQDLTQGFFSNLLERDSFATISKARGRMRTFMLSSLKNFAVKEHAKSNAQKRGGGKTILSIENEVAEARFQNEPTVQENPEKLYEREWAMALLASALGRLEEEYRSTGKGEVFEALRDSLAGDEPRGRYTELAESLGMNEGAIRVAVYRLRKRYRAVLVDEITQTVDTQDAVNDELDYLKRVFGS